MKKIKKYFYNSMCTNLGVPTTNDYSIEATQFILCSVEMIIIVNPRHGSFRMG